MKLAYNYAHLANIVSMVDFALSVYNAFFCNTKRIPCMFCSFIAAVMNYL